MVHANDCKICQKMGLKPTAIPGKMWVIGWALIDTPKEVVKRSFQEVIFDKMKGPTHKQQTKRKQIDKEAKVITEPEYLEELEKLEEGKKNKALSVAAISTFKTNGNIQNKSTKRKKQKEEETSSSSSSEECETDL